MQVFRAAYAHRCLPVVFWGSPTCHLPYTAHPYPCLGQRQTRQSHQEAISFRRARYVPLPCHFDQRLAAGGPLQEQSYRVGKQLLPPLDDRFSARHGTYRVIYRIDDKAHVVTVVDIGHRRDVYRTW
jgi:mRNA-degrading endonuclease RelE of RelBE toxin-antitoxin system